MTFLFQRISYTNYKWVKGAHQLVISMAITFKQSSLFLISQYGCLRLHKQMASEIEKGFM